MAFKKRNKNEDTGVSNLVIEEKSTSKPTNETKIPDVRSYQEQAVLVLNILEKDGINIYDETRTPGMYLKSTNNNISKQTIQNILMADKNSSLTENESSGSSLSKSQKAPKELFDFFMNNK